MFGSYLKTAFRSLWRERGYTAINVLGLAVGVAVSVLVAAYIRFETSYDAFHERANRIVRMVDGEDSSTNASLAGRLVPKLPVVTSTVRIRSGSPSRMFSGTRVEQGQRAFYEEGVLYADSTFFDVFSFPLVRGDPSEVLDQPFAVVLSQRLAEKYFPSQDPMGQTIRIGPQGEAETYEITGIAENPPANTHLSFSAIASFHTLGPREGPAPRRAKTYLVLDRPVAPEQLNEVLRPALSGLVPERQIPNYRVQPLSSIHLHSKLEGELGRLGHPTHLYIFGTLALIILLLAGVNYVNLATARAARRAAEVGIRKVVGGSPRELTLQFLGEAAIVGLSAGLLGYALVWAGRPMLGVLADVPANALPGGTGSLLVPTLGAGLAAGLLAGTYPALVLARIAPNSVMGGRSLTSERSGWLRKTLVVVQFAVSIAVVAGTFIIRAQIHFMETKDLGLADEQVLVLDVRNAVGNSYQTFKKELEQHPEIQAVSAVNHHMPVQRLVQTTREMYRPEGMPKSEFKTRWEEGSLQVTGMNVMAGITKALGVRLLQGRGFTEEYAENDSLLALVNQAAVEQFGWDRPIGKEIYMGMDDDGAFRVIGVMENFHYRGLDQKIDPLVLWRAHPRIMSWVLVRVSGGRASQALDEVRSVGSRFGDGTPLSYSFLDDRFEQTHRAQERLARITSSLSVVALVLAGMGLFGLASYVISRRTKEISIRKVLGATTERVLALVSRDFMKLVAMGFAVATPVAVLIMNSWLENFAYRIDLEIIHFISAGGVVGLVACVAIGYQAISAALLNPADTLRYE